MRMIIRVRQVFIMFMMLKIVSQIKKNHNAGGASPVVEIVIEQYLARAELNIMLVQHVDGQLQLMFTFLSPIDPTSVSQTYRPRILYRHVVDMHETCEMCT